MFEEFKIINLISELQYTAQVQAEQRLKNFLKRTDRI